MANAKTTLGRRIPTRTHRSKARLTTTLTVDARGALPKGKPTKIKPLLQRYREAFAKSYETGRPVSFRVDVAPDGGATVTPVEDPTPEAAPLAVEAVKERSPELEQALAAARERGRVRAAEILRGADMLSAEEFAELLGTTRVTVNTKRQNGQVLGLEGARRGFRFPAWQLNADGKPYPELPALLDRLGGPWAVYRLLVQPQGALGGLTGRAALERGKGRELVAAAEGIARGDFT